MLLTTAVAVLHQLLHLSMFFIIFVLLLSTCVFKWSFYNKFGASRGLLPCSRKSNNDFHNKSWPNLKFRVQRTKYFKLQRKCRYENNGNRFKVNIGKRLKYRKLSIPSYFYAWLMVTKIVSKCYVCKMCYDSWVVSCVVLCVIIKILCVLSIFE